MRLRFIFQNPKKKIITIFGISCTLTVTGITQLSRFRMMHTC